MTNCLDQACSCSHWQIHKYVNAHSTLSKWQPVAENFPPVFTALSHKMNPDRVTFSSRVFCQMYIFLQSWLVTTLRTNCLLWLTLSFVHSVPACGPCHCGLAHGLLLWVSSSRLNRLMCVCERECVSSTPITVGYRRGTQSSPAACDAFWHCVVFSKIMHFIFWFHVWMPLVCLATVFCFFSWCIVEASLCGRSADLWKPFFLASLHEIYPMVFASLLWANQQFGFNENLPLCYNTSKQVLMPIFVSKSVPILR